MTLDSGLVTTGPSGCLYWYVVNPSSAAGYIHVCTYSEYKDSKEPLGHNLNEWNWKFSSDVNDLKLIAIKFQNAFVRSLLHHNSQVQRSPRAYTDIRQIRVAEKKLSNSLNKLFSGCYSTFSTYM